MREKGIGEYLEAAEYIKERYPNTVFHVLGFSEEDYEEHLRSLHEQEVIQYHGMQRNIREYLAVSHCTIHPSYHEGMSNVLLESAASARPIITSNVSGCKEIVDDNISGYLVEKENSQDLIEKIEKFLRLPKEQKESMGLAGSAKMEEEFDRNIVVDAYVDEIKRMTL